MKLSDKAAQVVGWSQRRIDGYGSMTAIQLLVLRELQAALEADRPFVKLCAVRGATLRSLMERDLIMESKGLDGVRYKITGRGRNAIKVFSVPLEGRRKDSICPRCGTRKRYTRSTGELAPYCRECQSRISSRKWRLGISKKNPGICPRCQKRPKHITASGRVRSYCKHCRGVRRRREKKRLNKRNLKRIEAGEVLLCYTCKKRPRAVVNGWVRDYCPECQRAYMDAYNRKRRGKD